MKVAKTQWLLNSMWSIQMEVNIFWILLDSTDLNSDKAILEIKIEMPEEYLNADLIFDAAHLKAKKLVIK